MNKQKARIIILLFFILTSSAYIIWPIFKGKYEGENKENRILAEKPVLSFDTISDFPNQMELYINDHLPFRSLMIEANSLINYYFLHTSTSNNVVIGKEDWLFYDSQSSIDQYCGRKVYSEDQLEIIANNLQITQDNLDKLGIKFVLFIAPNRERVYSEYMPSYYGAPNENNSLDQVLKYLHDNTDINVVCPYKELIEYKETNPDMILYHKTDTHWNDLGAYIGTKVLFKEIGANWDESNITIEKEKDVPGDMANLLICLVILKQEIHINYPDIQMKVL